jgi:coenzyme F420-reducing hydrogenase beta subunit
MPKEPIDITPAGSVVPVYLEEPTPEELAERQSQHEAQEEVKALKETTRESALTKLAELGLTEEEISTLVGGIK